MTGEALVVGEMTGLVGRMTSRSGVGAYNEGMRGWSFSIGGVLGVNVRIHMFFALLLLVSVSYTSVAGVSVMRGVGLWLLLFLAVAVREIARGIAAAWFGLELRSILLLPTGALPTYATREETERAGSAEGAAEAGAGGADREPVDGTAAESGLCWGCRRSWGYGACWSGRGLRRATCCGR